MNAALSTDEPTPRKPLRLWPGVVAVVLQWLLWFVLPIVAPEATPLGVIGGVVAGLAIVVWWLFLSRAPWSERLGAIVLMIVVLVATRRIIHESIRNGMMGMMFAVYSIPVMSLAFVAWAVASRRLSGGRRHASLVAAILLACAGLTLVRTGGITGDANSDLHWRWTRTPEERFLAQVGDKPVAPPQAPAAAKAPKEEPPSSQAGN